MSARNTLDAKRARRARRAFKATPTAYIDLIEYIKLRTRCTTGTAQRALFADVLRVGPNPVGYQWDRGRKILSPCVPAALREKISFHAPKVND